MHVVNNIFNLGIDEYDDDMSVNTGAEFSGVAEDDRDNDDVSINSGAEFSTAADDDDDDDDDDDSFNDNGYHDCMVIDSRHNNDDDSFIAPSDVDEDDGVAYDDAMEIEHDNDANDNDTDIEYDNDVDDNESVDMGVTNGGDDVVAMDTSVAESSSHSAAVDSDSGMML
jgi:hypothetical protein